MADELFAAEAEQIDTNYLNMFRKGLITFEHLPGPVQFAILEEDAKLFYERTNDAHAKRTASSN